MGHAVAPQGLDAKMEGGEKRKYLFVEPLFCRQPSPGANIAAFPLSKQATIQKERHGK